ncbi:DoxX family protein [Salinigranum halophilum]|uniref:DoxX family protein n=1 Tax=Salinigranum halophilum TaxID=2565931 RepID=UPI00115CA963|nr:DoxX family membrane protein [Salinigranum halophilum]
MNADVVLQADALFGSTGAAVVFLLARVLFGAVMAFTGVNHFLNAETMSGYAGAKGVPLPGLAVPFSGGLLLFGGLGILLGVFPVLAAGAIALFLLVATPTMHDFWAAPDEEQMTEMTQFLKNVALLGTALGFLVVSQLPWPLAVGVGL